MAETFEEEADKGIPLEALMGEGASPADYADCLIVNEKLYEPTCCREGDGKNEEKVMIATHYRERGVPVL